MDAQEEIDFTVMQIGYLKDDLKLLKKQERRINYQLHDLEKYLAKLKGSRYQMCLEEII